MKLAKYKYDTVQPSELAHATEMTKTLIEIPGLVATHMVGNLLLTERYRIGFISTFH